MTRRPPASRGSAARMSAEYVLAAFTTRAPGTSWATISLDVSPPSGSGSRLGIGTALVASITISPDQDSPASASVTLAHGTTSATIEQRAASWVVPAVIPAPSAVHH